MGNQGDKAKKDDKELTDKEIEFIANNSNLSKVEIHNWHKKFLVIIYLVLSGSGICTQFYPSNLIWF